MFKFEHKKTNKKEVSSKKILNDGGVIEKPLTETTDDTDTAMHIIRLGVLASGEGSNLQAIIDEIESGTLPAKINVVVSDKEKSNALKRAAHHNIPNAFLDRQSVANAEKPNNAYDHRLLDILTYHKVDLLILAGYMRIVTSPLIAAYPSSIINIHPSLLPAFKGLNAQQQALEANATVSGCTTHFVTEGVDEGPVILQSSVPVEKGDDVDTLSKRILKEEHKILPETIRRYADGQIFTSKKEHS